MDKKVISTGYETRFKGSLSTELNISEINIKTNKIRLDFKKFEIKTIKLKVQIKK